jgi:hypothetical protein
LGRASPLGWRIIVWPKNEEVVVKLIAALTAAALIAAPGFAGQQCDAKGKFVK